MNETKFKHEALHLISEYFGEYTKSLYESFYEKKSKEVILTSLEELLLEMIGPEKAEEILIPMKKKYFLNDDPNVKE